MPKLISREGSMTTDTTDTLFQQIFKDEEDHNTVLCIREELMNRVEDECHHSYMQKQTVRFIVQCAYDALTKFLSFDFYYHPEVPDLSQSVWVADQPIEPSPKDTWSCDAVQVRSIERTPSQEIIHECESLSTSTKTVSYKGTSSDEIKGCFCLEHVCTCLASPGDLVKRLGSVHAKPCPSKVKFSPKSSKQSVITKHSDTSDRLSEREISQPISTTSTSNNTSELILKQDSDKIEDKIKKTQKKAKPKERNIRLEAHEDVSVNTSEPNIISLSPLPPIRVYSHFQSKPVELPKKRS